MKTFSERLAICLERGSMTPADAHFWFGRPRATVDSWIKRERTPRDRGGGVEAWRRLGLLEKAIGEKNGFPVPHDLSLTERPVYVRNLYAYAAGISRKNPARGRVQMRNGVR